MQDFGPRWRALAGIVTLGTLASCLLDEDGLAPADAAPRDFRDAGLSGTGGTGPGGSGGTPPTADASLPVDATGGADTTDAGIDGGADVAERAPPSPIGCADGTREGLVNVLSHPRIAACSGGWNVPGLLGPAATAPQCGRRAGNSGALPGGAGCSAADLCAEGWHVCDTASEVFQLAGDCKDAIGPLGAAPVFFATRQRALGNICVAANDAGTSRLHGCGNFGNKEDQSCAPLPFLLRDVDCSSNPPWSCPTRMMTPLFPALGEIQTVVKPGPARGGVLCCHD
jgi:hypothetical protein